MANLKNDKEKQVKETTKKTTKAKVEKEIKEENFDFFNSENMAKMYAMFKQFQQIEQENNKQDIKDNNNIKNEDNDKPFTKVMLSKVEDEVVTVKSAKPNVIFISPKSQIEYRWGVKGDVEVMSIREVLAMENLTQRFLHTPWLLVEDRRIIEAFNLQKLYDNISKIENIEELLKLTPEEIKAIFDNLPNEYKSIFRDEIYIKVKTGELRDIITINSLSDILGINLLD